jgi:RNA polymerase sigma-70 factor (ECF subfamily)
MNEDSDNLSNLSDEDLMGHYQAGNCEAFEILYRRHSPKVLQYFRKRTSREIAADLMQDVFMKLHKARAQYSRQYPFLPWLFAISKNALFDFLKSTKSSAEAVSIDYETLSLPSSIPVDTGLELNLSAAIKELPLNQRRVIELRYLNDWSFEEIAKDTKTSPENIRQIVSRSIAKIRKNLLKKD